jgi:hypothetical protein
MNKRWLILAAAVAVISTALVYVIRTYVPPPPYSGPVIYATLPAENEVVAIQAGPSVGAEFRVDGYGTDLAVSPSGTTLYLAGPYGLRVVDVSAGTGSTLQFGGLKALAISNDGKTLYAIQRPGIRMLRRARPFWPLI